MKTSHKSTVCSSAYQGKKSTSQKNSPHNNQSLNKFNEEISAKHGVGARPYINTSYYTVTLCARRGRKRTI